ncbi:MAG: hypothetical protein JRH20_28575 [Deltaproteobacteria bacterium]|nr:hypothetical protein [Deltaproteobacteria bacterium]
MASTLPGFAQTGAPRHKTPVPVVTPEPALDTSPVEDLSTTEIVDVHRGAPSKLPSKLPSYVPAPTQAVDDGDSLDTTVMDLDQAMDEPPVSLVFEPEEGPTTPVRSPALKANAESKQAPSLRPMQPRSREGTSGETPRLRARSRPLKVREPQRDQLQSRSLRPLAVKAPPTEIENDAGAEAPGAAVIAKPGGSSALAFRPLGSGPKNRASSPGRQEEGVSSPSGGGAGSAHQQSSDGRAAATLTGPVRIPETPKAYVPAPDSAFADTPEFDDDAWDDGPTVLDPDAVRNLMQAEAMGAPVEFDEVMDPEEVALDEAEPDEENDLSEGDLDELDGPALVDSPTQAQLADDDDWGFDEDALTVDGAGGVAATFQLTPSFQQKMTLLPFQTLMNRPTSRSVLAQPLVSRWLAMCHPLKVGRLILAANLALPLCLRARARGGSGSCWECSSLD